MSRPDDLKYTPDPSHFDQVRNHLQHRVVPIAMSHCDFRSILLARLDDVVCFSRRPDERLFDVHAFRPGLDRGQDHVTMLVDVPRTNGNDGRANLG